MLADFHSQYDKNSYLDFGILVASLFLMPYPFHSLLGMGRVDLFEVKF